MATDRGATRGTTAPGRARAVVTEASARVTSEARWGQGWWTSIRTWTTIVAAVLALSTLLAVAAVWTEQRAQSPTQQRLRAELRPAQVQTEQLITALDDQKIGLRGFLLTGRRESLAPYDAAVAEQRVLLISLRVLLDDYPTTGPLLEQVSAQDERWHRTVVEPQLAARSAGRVPEEEVVAFVEEDDRVFADLRQETSALSDEVGRLITVDLERFDAAQSTARTLQRAALVLAALGAVLLTLVLWRMSSRPLRRLVASLDAASAGDYSRPVPQGGPQEYARLARATERLRRRLLVRSAALDRIQREHAVDEERQRVANDLLDVTIQRVFALGLQLTSMASSEVMPKAADLQGLVGETDLIIEELRDVVFPAAGPEPTLPAALDHLAEQSHDLLGLRPQVVTTGPADLVPSYARREALSATRHALTRIASHTGYSQVRIALDVQSSSLEIVVEDDGQPSEQGPGGSPAGPWRHTSSLVTTRTAGGVRQAWSLTWEPEHTSVPD